MNYSINKSIFKFSLISLLICISGCSQNSFFIKTRDQIFKGKSTDTFVNKTIEVSTSCNKNNIQSYLDDGWEISSQTDSEVPCTWKTTKANKRCDVKRDKGCLITVPDKIGIKTVYTLNKKVKLDNK